MTTQITGDTGVSAVQSGVVQQADLVAPYYLPVPQTWQDVTASRVANTLYTNNTGQPIQVLITCNDAAGWSSIATVAGLIIAQFGGNNSFGTCTFTVPSGATYKVNPLFGTFKWLELR